jgi:biopolymer transport protein ExbD
MSTPSTMDLFMPKDTEKDEEQNKAKESGALTIMMGKDDHIYYYEGKLAPDASNFKSSNYKEIRDVIINKRKNTPVEDLVIVLKPNKEATYKNTVDMLDEMTINGIKRFALVDIAEVEDQLILLQKEAGQHPLQQHQRQNNC